MNAAHLSVSGMPTKRNANIPIPCYLESFDESSELRPRQWLPPAPLRARRSAHRALRLDAVLRLHLEAGARGRAYVHRLSPGTQSEGAPSWLRPRSNGATTVSTPGGAA